MPKKHQPHYSKISGTRNSLSNSALNAASVSTGSLPSTKSVNERLNELRREANPRANAQRRDDFASAVAQRSVPMTPMIRRILDIPEGSTPVSRARPRRGRVPGPAAPRSWLKASRHAPVEEQDGDYMQLEDTSGRFSILSELKDSPLGLPNARSLAHYTLKQLTLHWEELVEFEQFYIPTLPINLKGQILAYLGAYSSDNGLSLSSLRLLFPRETESSEPASYEDVRQLDLSGLLSDSLTVSALNRLMVRSNRGELTTKLKELSMDSSSDSQEDDVAESWEIEAEVVKPDAPLRTIRFPNLTRLSLSQPGDQASWLHLLQLSQHLPKLTHLSIAYWSSPSLTPNATTTSVVSKHSSPVALGGTHYYSGLDDDWYEAANILRRLSNNLYCLEWLDLEGCTWAGAAFSWSVRRKMLSTTGGSPATVTSSHSAFDDVEEAVDGGPDFNGSWRQLAYINMSQGWIPCNTESIRQMPAGQLGIQLLSYIREHDGISSGRIPLRVPNTTSSLRAWLDRERQAMEFERGLRLLRSKAQGKFCKVDRGWEAVQAHVRQQEQD